MKIKDILKKQGELYKNLTSNKTIQKHNKTIKPKPPELVPYRNYKISKLEYKAITELEKLINEKPVIVSLTGYLNFEIEIEDNKITHLKIENKDLTHIPKSICNLKNLQRLDLCNNKIKKIESLDNLTNLQHLLLYDNQIKEIENLDNLTELILLGLGNNPITKIKGLDNLINLSELHIYGIPIENIEEIEKLGKKGIGVYL